MRNICYTVDVLRTAFAPSTSSAVDRSAVTFCCIGALGLMDLGNSQSQGIVSAPGDSIVLRFNDLRL